MAVQSENSEQKKEIAIQALLVNPNVPTAATKAGVSERTLWRWLQDEKFQSDYKDARRKAVAVAIGNMQVACSEAIMTLRDVMTDTQNPATARVSAARAVLDMTLKSIEIEELTERIEKLEKRGGR